MRQPRFTYTGAFHHCMNRGHNGEPILTGDASKKAFLEMLAEKVIQYRMRLFAYCLMDNHYHLVLQNASGRMSDFFRNLNTQYAFYYRRHGGGKGYVFQSRFHSTIISEDEYLKMAIIYVLQNPMRAGLANRSNQYLWSSEGLYFKTKGNEWLDSRFVLEMFGGRKNLSVVIKGKMHEKLPLVRTPFGPVMGDDGFFKRALERFDRRHRADAIQKRRRDDYDFDPVEKVLWEFERKHEVKVDELDAGHYAGKRLRAELLVRLRDLAGLTYKQIGEIEVFADLQYGSLRQIYSNTKGKKDDG